MILKYNAWSFSTPSDIILPDKLKVIFDHFNTFYKNLHNGRKISWLYQLSSGELQMFVREKPCILQVNNTTNYCSFLNVVV